MSALDPAILALTTAGLVLISVASGIWAMFANRAAAAALCRRRIGRYAPAPDRKRQPNSEAEVHRAAKVIRARRRSQGGGLSLRLALNQAGLAWPVWTVPIMAMLAVAVLAGGANVVGLAPLFAALFGLATGPGFLLLTLRTLRTRRKKAMEREFPVALDIIVRGVKSGLPLIDCLRVVAREVGDPLGTEFASLVQQQGHGVPIADAVDRLADRVPLSEVNFFAIVIGLQTKTGGRLAESLDNLVGVLRARVQLRAKIRSMSSEAKASSSIIAALPAVVSGLVFLTSPAYMSLLFAEFIGQIVLIASALWMLIGVLVMRKMIHFDH